MPWPGTGQCEGILVARPVAHIPRVATVVCKCKPHGRKEKGFKPLLEALAFWEEQAVASSRIGVAEHTPTA